MGKTNSTLGYQLQATVCRNVLAVSYNTFVLVLLPGYDFFQLAFRRGTISDHSSWVNLCIGSGSAVLDLTPIYASVS